MPKLIGDTTVHPDTLAKLKERTPKSGNVRWAAYQNHALDSAQAGHLIFLPIGEGCTFQEAPEHAPDGHHGMGWKYLHVGWVDLLTGEIGGESDVRDG